MPRDANGNYTLPAGNPVVTDTNIASTWANDTMQDIGAEITDSLSRSGKGGVTGPFQIIDSQGGVPGLAFSNEPTSGLKREGLGDVRLQVQGNDRMRWRSGASQVPEVQVAGVWKEVALLEASRKVMQGVGDETVVWFYNATVPAAAGWSLETPDANVRTLMVGGTGGTIAGSQDPSNTSLGLNTTVTVNLPADTGGHALTAAENGPHTHSYTVPVFNGGGAPGGSAAQLATGGTTGSSGSGTAHTHPLGGTAAGTGTGTAAITPRYAMGVLGKLDA